MNIFITYSNELYEKTRKFSAKMAKRYGNFDKVIEYEPEDIDVDFYSKNKEILSIKQGNGLWLWKPYFVYKTLLESNENDIIFYCDAGAFFIKDVRKIINTMDDDIWISDIPLIEKQFTKKDAFILMNCDNKIYKETNQIQANFIAVKNTKKSKKFVKQWLDYCCNINILSPHSIKPNMDNIKEFIGHREDQSVLSLLSKKWSLKSHLDPTQYGKLPEKYYAEGRLYKVPKHEKEYPVCIILHRTADVKFKTCLNQWICSWLPKKLCYLFMDTSERRD